MIDDGNESRIKINYHAFNTRKKYALVILHYFKQTVSICCLTHSRYFLNENDGLSNS